MIEFTVLLWKYPGWDKYYAELYGKQDLDLGYASQDYLARKAKAKYPTAKVLTTRNKAHPCNNQGEAR